MTAGFLRIGDFVEYGTDAAEILSIKKCQPNGHCLYDLNGVCMTMLTQKIIVTANFRGATVEIHGNEIRKI